MNYTIAAIPTIYAGVNFRSRLEARYAAFFDIVGWKWAYEPVDLKGWTPDFEVIFSCLHSECNGKHTLLVEVKPYTSIDQFKGSPEYMLAMVSYGCGEGLPCDAVALFGVNPGVSYWEMMHGDGGGKYEIDAWVRDWENAWKEAGNIVQWKPKQPVAQQNYQRLSLEQEHRITPYEIEDELEKDDDEWYLDENYWDWEEEVVYQCAECNGDRWLDCKYCQKLFCSYCYGDICDICDECRQG